jgi:hypothetical protein
MQITPEKQLDSWVPATKADIKQKKPTWPTLAGSDRQVLRRDHVGRTC